MTYRTRLRFLQRVDSTSIGSPWVVWVVAGVGVGAFPLPFGAHFAAPCLPVVDWLSAWDVVAGFSLVGLPRNRSGTPRAAVSAGPTKQPSIELQMYPCDNRRRICPYAKELAYGSDVSGSR